MRRRAHSAPRAPFRFAANAAAAALLAVALAFPSPAAAQSDEPDRPRLSPLDFKVFNNDRPVTGTYRFVHPLTGESGQMSIRMIEGEDRVLVGVLKGSGLQVLTLTPRSEGVGWKGELRGILTTCGQDKVPVVEMLPLGDSLVLRLEADPPETPCPFLEDPASARLVVAPTTVPIRMRSSREIVSSKTKEQIGLAGQPGDNASPIVAGAVSVEGGTELKFLGRTRSLDGSVWIEVESVVSPAPGIEPPRGFMRAAELRIDASITLQRLDGASGS